MLTPRGPPRQGSPASRLHLLQSRNQQLPGGTLNLDSSGTVQDIFIGDPNGFTALTIDAPNNDAFVIDNITYDFTSEVPEPAIWSLMGASLAALALVRRSRLLRASFSTLWRYH